MKRYLAVFVLAITLLMLNSQLSMAGPELQGAGSIYYVSWGDTLTGIALRHGVSVEAILRHNGLANPEMIYVGQPLIIPNQAYGGPASYDSSGCANYHTVRAGETLSNIAWNYDLSMPDLLRYNNLYNKDVLFVGQRLCVPARGGYAPQNAVHRGPAPAVASAHYHTVTGGETLSSIAYRYGVNQWNIVQANNLSNASYIWVGQKLIIPGYQPQQQYSTPAPTYDKPHYGPPTAPSHKPGYEDIYDDQHEKKPPYKDPDDGYDKDFVSEPPDYEPNPVYPLLPRAEHPIEVIVNGGETWADEINARPDPDGITTLIVKTGQEEGELVRVRSGDAEIKGESGPVLNGEFGSYRFVVRHIAPGDYDVWIDDPDVPSEITKAQIDPGERVEIFFDKQVRFQGQTFASPDGWVLTGWENESEPGKILGGWSTILVRTPASGLWIILEAEGGGFQAKCLTGSKGAGACEFGGLSAGLYNIWIDGTYFTIKTYLDGAASATFDLNYQADESKPVH